MSHPGDGDEGEGGGGSGAGAALGFVLTVIVVPGLLFTGPAGWFAIAVLLVGAVVLVARDTPFERGLGGGALGGFAVLLFVLGACFAIVARL